MHQRGAKDDKSTFINKSIIYEKPSPSLFIYTKKPLAGFALNVRN